MVWVKEAYEGIQASAAAILCCRIRLGNPAAVVARTKTRTKLQAELDALRRSGNYRAWGNIATAAIKWGVFAWIAYLTSTAVPQIAESWAGKTTRADISAEFNADIQVNSGAADPVTAPAQVSTVSPIWFFAFGAWGVFGLMALGYGYLQKRLREEALRSLGGFRAIVEREIDPNRSSSELLPNGKEPRQ